MNPLKSPLPFGARILKSRNAGIAMVEAVIGAGLVAVMLACLFATNAHLLGLLRQGKQSIFATQLITERIERIRTGTFSVLTVAGKTRTFAEGATVTSKNFPGVTETFTVEPIPNPSNVRIVTVRNPDGTVTQTGTDLTTDTVIVETVKLSINIKWNTVNRQRERGFSTIMTSAGL